MMAAIIILFMVQLYYYAIAYYRIYRFRLMRRRKKHDSMPPISVIVALRGESDNFLTTELPALLQQQYDHYEIVVVYIGGDMEYYEELQRIRDSYSYMRLTKMGGNDHVYITNKQALNVGIKSAQYDALLFTTPGAVPLSEKWIALMAKGFERGSVVLGPVVPSFENNSLKTYLMRLTELHRLRNAMSRAVVDKLYYAPRSNYGFTRELYESTRGYNHLGIDIGDNDLYLQDITRPEHIAVVLSPHSLVAEERPSQWSEWMEHMRYYGSTAKDYLTSVKTFIRRQRDCRLLFFLTAVTALAVLPLELKCIVAGLILLRYAIVVWTSHRTARKLGERGIALRYWIYDLIGPFIEWMIGSHESHNTPRVWR